MKLVHLLIFACTTSMLWAVDELPARPEQIKYPELKSNIPNRNDFKHVLDGATAFVVEDHTLPLVNIGLYVRGGAYLQPVGKEGLAVLTGTMMRNGGTQSLDPVAFQERIDFLSTNVSASFSDTQLRANLNCLRGNLEESLQLFFDMLLNPRFDEERFGIEKRNMLEEMRKRNDDTRAMEPRYWSKLLYGESFYGNQMSSEASIASISADDMRAFLKSLLVKGNLTFAISGDIDAATVKAVLKPLLAKVPKGKIPPEPPKNWKQSEAGLYGVNKDGVNQTRVMVGYQGLQAGNPDEAAVDVMNNVLGGGGFSSRITSRVRSDEGLAYSAGSIFTTGYEKPGQFVAYYQSKNESVAYALKIVLEEINRVRDQQVNESELKIAKQALVADILPLFDNPGSTARQFARAEMENEPADYLKKYQENIAKTTLASVQAAAQKYLQPDKLIVLITGDLEACKPGDGHGSLEEVAGKTLNRLPLYDPMTLKVLN